MRTTLEDDVLSLDEENTYPYASEFLHFIDEAATVYHAADYFKRELIDAGYVELKESEVYLLIITKYSETESE